MMACCADRLVASPFAVLGSIGVISEQPNVYDRLKREGVEFQTVTAGKWVPPGPHLSTTPRTRLRGREPPACPQGLTDRLRAGSSAR